MDGVGIEKRLTAGRQEGVGVHGPVALLPVVGNGLDQVTVRGAHANPQGGDGVRGTTAGAVGEDESRGGFTDEGVGGDRTGAEGGAHGGVDRGGAEGKGRENLVAGVHDEMDGRVFNLGLLFWRKKRLESRDGKTLYMF